ncbi:hypothetical protein MMC32_002032 [Xylographa parallela]|nr:hypothetical protein [Xylographa parallela]
MNYLILLAFCFVAATAQVQCPNPQPCSGACGSVHDPAIVKKGKDSYYRFSTFGGISIATAPDLKGPWTVQGDALPGGSMIDLPGNTNIWAPDVHHIGNLYYMYYAVSTGGSQNSAIGVASSPSMDTGTWTDHGSLGILQSPNYNLIDPNLLIVDYGASLLLSFGSFWTDIYQIELSDPLTIAPGASPYQLDFNSTGIGSVEGSYQFWWPTNGTIYYYLFSSSGACCNTPPNLPPPGDEYHINVCRSETPNGGFVDKNGVSCLSANGGSLVLGSHDNVYAPGGEGVMYDSDVGLVLYYHYVNPTIGYDSQDFQFGFNVFSFDVEGWPVVTG